MNFRLEESLLARVDAVAGPRGRTGFVVRALEAALSGTPVGEFPPAERAPGGPAVDAARPAASPRASVSKVRAVVPQVRPARELVKDSAGLARQERLERLLRGRP